MEIAQRLDDTRAQLQSAIEGLSDEQLNWKPAVDVWSIAQIIEHLMLVETGSAKAVRLGLKQDRTFVPRELPLEDTLPNRSRKFSAPEMTQPTSGSKSKAELMEQMGSTRTRLLDMIAGIEQPEDLNCTSPPVPHPAFGPLSSGQWLTTIVLHEQRHIGQIEELKSQMPDLA